MIQRQTVRKCRISFSLDELIQRRTMRKFDVRYMPTVVPNICKIAWMNTEQLRHVLDFNQIGWTLFTYFLFQASAWLSLFAWLIQTSLNLLVFIRLKKDEFGLSVLDSADNSPVHEPVLPRSSSPERYWHHTQASFSYQNAIFSKGIPGESQRTVAFVFRYVYTNCVSTWT